MTEQRFFRAGIVDFNQKRMTSSEAKSQGIPPELYGHLADLRQYAPTIASHFPHGTAWFDLEHPWFAETALASPDHLNHLKDGDVLFLSGSGQSAYKFQERIPGAFTPEQLKTLAESQKLVRSILGSGKWAFGICYGGQVAIHAVGGKIGRLPEDHSGVTPTEAGWLEHKLTVAGRQDEVFGGLPATFSAAHLHSDYVAILPSVGHQVETDNGQITVIRADILAIRRGYLWRGKIHHPDQTYIHASVVEFDNGARLYQVQPHPEMATEQKADFLVRQNESWLRKELGEGDFSRALSVPQNADFGVAKTITKFVSLAERRAQELHAVDFVIANIPMAIDQYLLR